MAWGVRAWMRRSEGLVGSRVVSKAGRPTHEKAIGQLSTCPVKGG